MAVLVQRALTNMISEPHGEEKNEIIKNYDMTPVKSHNDGHH